VIGRKRKKKKRKGDEDMNEVGFVSTHHWNNEPSLSEKARHGAVAVPHCMYVSIFLIFFTIVPPFLLYLLQYLIYSIINFPSFL
jgi:hypothetical protein